MGQGCLVFRNDRWERQEDLWALKVSALEVLHVWLKMLLNVWISGLGVRAT